MSDLNRSDSAIELKQNPIFLYIGICACIMGIFGFRLLLGLLPLEAGYTAMDIFGVVFVCVWILTVWSMGFFTLATASRKITINCYGVSCKSWFQKDFLSWYDIRDWGLSYYGQTRGEGNTYYLYFSPALCEQKKECTKKLKGKMIKGFIVGDEYGDAINRIIPFCRQWTGVTPFIAEDRFHMI